MSNHVKIYESFSEMFSDLTKGASSFVAFKYWVDEQIHEMKIDEFYQLILQKVAQYEAETSSHKAIIGPMSISLLVNFFASVIAGKTTLLIDAMLPLPLILQMMKVGQADSLALEEDYFEEDEKKSLREALLPANKCPRDKEGDILFFTSGTTSLSKAVVLTSKSLLRAAYNGQNCLAIHPGDVLLSCLPMSHVFGFVCAMLWPLCNKASIAISRGLRRIPEDLALFHATYLSQVPTAVEMLLKYQAFNPELKVILIGAGPIGYPAIHAIKEKGIAVSFGYGLTETSSGVAISVNKEDPYAMDLCPDTICRIQKDGEVLLKTPCLMKGYYRDEKSTKEVIKEGYLHTGDIGYLDHEGCLHITGRKNDVVVLSNGTKINLEEWERSLAKQFVNLDFALVYLHEQITLFYHLVDGQYEKLVEEGIKRFNHNCPFGQAIQQKIKIEQAIPRTLTGKVQRYALGAKNGQKLH